MSEGVDLRTEKEALDFLRNIAAAEGLSLNEIRDEQAGLTHVEAMAGPSSTAVDPSSIRFSIGSLREVEEIKTRVGTILRMLAARRASLSGRTLVTDVDVDECVSEAFDQAIRTSPDK